MSIPTPHNQEVPLDESEWRPLPDTVAAKWPIDLIEIDHRLPESPFELEEAIGRLYSGVTDPHLYYVSIPERLPDEARSSALKAAKDDIAKTAFGPRDLLQLEAKLAEHYGVEPDQVIGHAGAENAIDLAIHAAQRAGVEHANVGAPYFPGIMRSVKAHGMTSTLHQQGLDGDLTELSRAARTSTERAVYVACRPHAYTHGAGAAEQLTRIARAGHLTLVDEAYHDLVLDSDQSLVKATKEVPYLMVARSLSKEWNLTNARVGCLIGNAAAMKSVRRLRAFFPLPYASMRLAILALTDPEWPQRLKAHLGRQRAEAARVLASAGARVVHASGSRLVVDFTNAHVGPNDAMATLAAQGVPNCRVRNLSLNATFAVAS